MTFSIESKLAIRGTTLSRAANAVILSLGILILFNSCKKIQENKILNGTWEVVKVELGQSDFNVMETFLRNYKSNHVCCKYIVDFREDNTCSGAYYYNDSLVYAVEGEWELKEFNLVYVKLDQYVFADLEVNRHSKMYYSLDTDSNTVAALNNEVLPTTLEIKKLN